MIVTTKELFAHAYAKYAVGAYNINNLEQAMGGCSAATSASSRAPMRTSMTASPRRSSSRSRAARGRTPTSACSRP